MRPTANGGAVESLRPAHTERCDMSTSQDKGINIIVNGRPKKVPDQAISFEEVVALAFNPVPPNALFTVTWSQGNQSGSLVAGKSVAVQNGMKFDVTETGQS